MSECVTHHHACDCREAKFAELEAENKALREAADLYSYNGHFPDCALNFINEKPNCTCGLAELKLVLQEQGDVK